MGSDRVEAGLGALHAPLRDTLIRVSRIPYKGVTNPLLPQNGQFLSQEERDPLTIRIWLNCNFAAPLQVLWAAIESKPDWALFIFPYATPL